MVFPFRTRSGERRIRPLVPLRFVPGTAWQVISFRRRVFSKNLETAVGGVIDGALRRGIDFVCRSTQTSTSLASQCNHAEFSLRPSSHFVQPSSSDRGRFPSI